MLICILAMIAVCAADQLIKYYIVTHLKEGEKRYYLGGRFRLTRYHNKGIALSKLFGHVSAIRNCTAVLIGFLIWIWVRMFRKGDRPVALLGGSLMIGGAFGNLIDRCFRKYVVDYAGVKTGSKRLSSLVFNLADIALAVGAVMLSLFRRMD